MSQTIKKRYLYSAMREPTPISGNLCQGHPAKMSSHGINRASGQAGFADTWASTSQSAAMPIPDLLRGMEAIVVAVIGRDGELKDANRGFLLLLTRSSTSPQPADIRDLFVSPRFADFVTRHSDPFEGTVYRGLISFGRAGSKTTSLRGAVYGYENDFVLVAEHDIVGVETLRATLLELQDALSEKQRRIVHLEHQMARLQELADAAMRDRDTLLDALAQSEPTSGDTVRQG